MAFDDSLIGATSTIYQGTPQGGFGRDAIGRMSFGDATNEITITNIIHKPQRIRAKGQKFAIKYKISSSDVWQLDNISQTYIPFDHYKFPSYLKLNSV